MSKTFWAVIIILIIIIIVRLFSAKNNEDDYIDEQELAINLDNYNNSLKKLNKIQILELAVTDEELRNSIEDELTGKEELYRKIDLAMFKLHQLLQKSPIDEKEINKIRMKIKRLSKPYLKLINMTLEKYINATKDDTNKDLQIIKKDLRIALKEQERSIAKIIGRI